MMLFHQTPKHLHLISRSLLTFRRLLIYPRSLLLPRPPLHGQVSNEKPLAFLSRGVELVGTNGTHASQSNSSPPPDYRDLGFLVYKGRFDRAIRFIRIVFFINLVNLLPFLAYVAWQGWAAGKLSLGYLQPMAAPVLVLSVVQATLHYATRGFIAELHFNPDTEVFTATELTFFTRERQFRFKAKDVRTRSFPVIGPVLLYKGRMFIFGKAQFRSDDVYNHLMGL
ncbi:unnamed protein product [Lymnaea stagnalis]|uniref:Transmembrane protein 186 n=1 Tax=Lymnaea stagnalis TaxID=6523 RepID=A0AAV2H6N0_LYMST